MKLIIWHLKIVERLDGQDIEPYSAVDEGPVNLNIADDWGAEHRKDTGRCRALELIC